MRLTSLSITGSIFVSTLLLAACVAPTPPAGDSMMKSSEAAMMEPDHILMTPESMRWANAPAALPAGAKVAAMEGDTSKAESFTLRFTLPANYKIAPHYHPADEHVTVLSGDFWLGMGSEFDESAMENLGPGGFAMMKAGTRHFAMSKNGAVIQLHGVGPWGLTYVNPEDDPRSAP